MGYVRKPLRVSILTAEPSFADLKDETHFERLVLIRLTNPGGWSLGKHFEAPSIHSAN